MQHDKLHQVITFCGEPCRTFAEAMARLLSQRDARIAELEACLSPLLEECDPMQLNAGEPWCRARSLIDDQQTWTCSECGQATTDEYEHFDHIADCGDAAYRIYLAEEADQ